MKTGVLVETKKIFDIQFFSGSLTEAVIMLLAWARFPLNEPKIAVTPNVDHIVRLKKDSAFARVYQKADFYFPDGAPIILGSRLLGNALRSRVTGADLMPALLDGLNKERALIIGGFPGEEQEIELKIRQNYPNIEIKCLPPPKGFKVDSVEASRIRRMAVEYDPLVTFICIGSPRQEEFAQLLKEDGVGKVTLCCGAALDFIIGNSTRAPLLVQRCGLEWLWRLVENPARLWRRYIVEDTYFILVFLRELRKSLSSKG